MSTLSINYIRCLLSVTCNKQLLWQNPAKWESNLHKTHGSYYTYKSLAVDPSPFHVTISRTIKFTARRSLSSLRPCFSRLCWVRCSMNSRVEFQMRMNDSVLTLNTEISCVVIQWLSQISCSTHLVIAWVTVTSSMLKTAHQLRASFFFPLCTN